MSFPSSSQAKAFFRKIPGSADGVNMSELKTFLVNSGKDPNEVACAFDDLDIDDDGSITEGEFVYAVCKEDRDKTLAQLFREMDTDGSDSLSLQEINAKCPLVQHMKNAQSEFQAADKDNSSTLTMEEFVALMKKCGR